MSKKNKKFNFKNIDEVAAYAEKSLFKANDYAISVSENVLTASIKRGSKWQNFTQKSIDNGFNMIEKQQDRFFNKLESMKSVSPKKENIVKAGKKAAKASK